jgi:uncharacterized damage-inducible protein DinB
MVSYVPTIRRLVDYNRRVFDRYLRSAVRRGWKAATKNRETGHRSIKDTLMHILNVHEAWLVAIAQDRWEVFDTPGRRGDAVRSWAELRKYRDRVWHEIDTLMGRLTEADLRRRVKAPWMPGKYTLEDAFFQTSFEQAHHLGEIIGVYWQADWTPASMTWIENQPRSARRR